MIPATMPNSDATEAVGLSVTARPEAPILTLKQLTEAPTLGGLGVQWKVSLSCRKILLVVSPSILSIRGSIFH